MAPQHDVADAAARESEEPASLEAGYLKDYPLHRRTLGEVLRHKAERNGDRVFLRYEDRQFSYRDAHLLSNRLANGLLAAGVGRGQHVAILLENRPEVLWLHFALAKIGAPAIPINNAAKGELLVYYIEQSDSSVVAIETSLLEQFLAVQDRCPKVRLVVVFDVDRPALARFRATALTYESLLEAPDHAPPSEARFNDLLHLLYTSGTTGPSKGSMVAHCTAIAVAAKYVRANGYGRDDVLYTCLPLFHGNAMNCTVLPALLADATVALSRRFSARAFWSDVRKFEATQITLLSAMINILWLQPESPLDRQHKVRLCQMVPTPSFFHDFEKRYGIKITSIYSLSDFGIGAMLRPDHPPEKWQAAGKVEPEVSVAILDDDDLPLPTGQVGEICMRNNEPWIARQGYYKMEAAFAAACRNLWFHTGDRGYLDADGYLYFVDRKKDAIRRRGENISAYEVEQIIGRHPAVAEVAAFPIPSEMSEDEVMVSIVCKDGATIDPAELIGFCAANMAYFMVPRYVEFVGQLEKTMTQKVQKYKLRESAIRRLHEIWDREKAGIRVKR